MNVVPIWWSRGQSWYNPRARPAATETGFLVQATTCSPSAPSRPTHNFGWTSNDLDRKSARALPLRRMYVEFVNGFTGKLAYRSIDNYGYTFAGLPLPHNDLITRKYGSSRLAWLRVQAKLADIGNPQLAKQVFVVEQSINVTPKVKFFNRFAFGNDPDKLRKSIFTQLKYNPSGSMDMFLQYGPDYIGGGSFRWTKARSTAAATSSTRSSSSSRVLLMRASSFFSALLLAVATLVATAAVSLAAPEKVSGGIRFHVQGRQRDEGLVGRCVQQLERQRQPMTKDANGVWSVVVALPPGEQQYKFVVDNNWFADPTTARPRATSATASCASARTAIS